ncbi:hypothetical protein PtA15_16A236 [Puccinia triticina]|uniref:Uncharacterized protein n=1 Tax=Puccinia triticina TaxID=208348 RepID=A0ABY7D8H6_9BASI|nr:uncharacterized protein PtA15_16A236 [Puccinia triticina]WAQ92330.1 hypothetical protein PtA15_16A236 [Puccinia triticina]
MATTPQNTATSTAMSFQTTLGLSDSHLTYPEPDSQRRKKFKPSIDPLVQPGHLPEVPLHIGGPEAKPDVEMHSWNRINPEPAVGEYPGQHPIQQPYPHPATPGAAPFSHPRLPDPMILLLWERGTRCVGRQAGQSDPHHVQTTAPKCYPRRLWKPGGDPLSGGIPVGYLHRHAQPASVRPLSHTNVRAEQCQEVQDQRLRKKRRYQDRRHHYIQV